MRRLPFFILLFFTVFNTFAEGNRPAYVSHRSTQPIKVDGQISELEWHLTPSITEFK